MRILLVDPDELGVSALAKQLKADGHDVVYAGKPAMLWAQFRIRPPDVVVLDLSRRRMNGFDLAQELRNERGADLLEIILTSPKHAVGNPEVERLMQLVGARFFYPKPLDVGQVVADLETPRTAASARPAPAARKPAPRPAARKPGPPNGAPAPSRPMAQAVPPTPVNWNNARALVGLWANRRTGHVVLAGDGLSGTAGLLDGGLVDGDGYRIVEQALGGGVVVFREAAVDGTGDWSATGAHIFHAAKKGCSAATIRRYLHSIPDPNEHTVLARTLPLGKATKAVMGGVNGRLNLEEICQRKQVTVGDVSEEIETLVKLELLQLRHPEDSGTAVAGGPSDGVGIELDERDKLMLRAARESDDLEGAVAMDVGHVASANRRERPSHLRMRLERELRTISDSPPPVVLGVPPDAPMKVVDGAASRMRIRYSRMVADEMLPKETRGLAKEIAVIVGEARRNFDFSGASAAAEQRADQDDLDRLLELGRTLIAQSDWQGADRALTKAHSEQLDHAAVLANLGWARLHNPKRPADQRAEEGRDFLLLAEQFDPDCAEGQYYLAQVCLASGQLDAAAVRAKRAVDLAPDESLFAALHRKVQVKVALAED